MSSFVNPFTTDFASRLRRSPLGQTISGIGSDLVRNLAAQRNAGEAFAGSVLGAGAQLDRSAGATARDLLTPTDTSASISGTVFPGAAGGSAPPAVETAKPAETGVTPTAAQDVKAPVAAPSPATAGGGGGAAAAAGGGGSASDTFDEVRFPGIPSEPLPGLGHSTTMPEPVTSAGQPDQSIYKRETMGRNGQKVWEFSNIDKGAGSGQSKYNFGDAAALVRGPGARPGSFAGDASNAETIQQTAMEAADLARTHAVQASAEAAIADPYGVKAAEARARAQAATNDLPPQAQATINTMMMEQEALMQKYEAALKATTDPAAHAALQARAKQDFDESTARIAERANILRQVFGGVNRFVPTGGFPGAQ